MAAASPAAPTASVSVLFVCHALLVTCPRWPQPVTSSPLCTSTDSNESGIHSPLHPLKTDGLCLPSPLFVSDKLLTPGDDNLFSRRTASRKGCSAGAGTPSPPFAATVNQGDWDSSRRTHKKYIPTAGTTVGTESVTIKHLTSRP